jgi:hypothetical protein
MFPGLAMGGPADTSALLRSVARARTGEPCVQCVRHGETLLKTIFIFKIFLHYFFPVPERAGTLAQRMKFA